jgi:hypothetical protein
MNVGNVEDNYNCEGECISEVIFLIVTVFAEEKHIRISLAYVKEMEHYKVQLMHLMKAQ